MTTLFRLYYIHWIKRFIEDKKFKGKWRLGKFLESVTPELRDNIIVKTKNGLKLKISPLYDKGIERKIFNQGIYEEGALWCFKKILRKGDIVFDVGANIGLTAIYAGRVVGKKGLVYAFEPMPSTFNILTENIELNKMKNVVPVEIALSNNNGEGVIYENLHINRGAASLYSQGSRNGINIKICRLDKFIKDLNILKIDFIKIDIEGAEIPMLQGAVDFFSNFKKPIICIEFSRNVLSNYDPDYIYDLLKHELKYDIFKQLSGKESCTPLIKVEGKGDLPNHDNLYCFQKYHYKNLPNDLFSL